MKKEKLERILNEFDRLFPNASCELNYTNELELLIAVMLSAQTTDKSVNKLTEKLFVKYRCVEDYADASIEELQNDIKTIGLYRNKAKNIKLMASQLIERHEGKVPSSHSELCSLAGVGRKTANVVLSEVFKIPAFAVDTHVERIAKRLGFAYNEDTVLTVEQKLMKKIKKNRWIKTHHQMIFFGRYFCKAINPSCDQCHLQDLCKEKKKRLS